MLCGLLCDPHLFSFWSSAYGLEQETHSGAAASVHALESMLYLLDEAHSHVKELFSVKTNAAVSRRQSVSEPSIFFTLYLLFN